MDSRDIINVIIKGNPVLYIYKKGQLLWEYISSCFSRGFWDDNAPWNDDTPWVD